MSQEGDRSGSAGLFFDSNFKLNMNKLTLIRDG